jgi:hypothetical protein
VIVCNGRIQELIGKAISVRSHILRNNESLHG